MGNIQKLTFGTTAATRHNTVNSILAGGVISGLVLQLCHTGILLAFLIPSAIFALATLVNLTFRHQLEISFAQGVYYIETGSWPAVKVTGGHLREVSHISITRDLQDSLITYAAFIEFHPEVKREPYRLDLLPCSVPVGSFEDKVALCVELAARLNVPVYDDSGWNGWRSPILEPRQIIIQPGETHPVLLQPPIASARWKKW